MKVSLNWLREYVDLPPSVESLVDLLTLAGIEVEDTETRGCAIANVVVAQIRESLPHPNADRLSVCQVDDGSGNPRQIVCGAKNYKAGDKVPLALPGAVLPGDFKIKVGKLRGVESEGMMCSPKELRLSEDAEGLLLLPGEAKVGAPIADILPSDTILEIEITPNRADLLSHWGIACEIAALTRAKTKPIQWERSGLDGGENIAVEVAPGPRIYYTARLVRGVKIAPSPDWLRTKLESLGFRSINNVVDITNYVMLGVGQPLHAFDPRNSMAVASRFAWQRLAKSSSRSMVIVTDSHRKTLSSPMPIASSPSPESWAARKVASAMRLRTSFWKAPGSIPQVFGGPHGVSGYPARAVIVSSAGSTNNGATGIRLRRSFARRHRASGNGAQRASRRTIRNLSAM